MKPRNLKVYSHYPERSAGVAPQPATPMPYLRLCGRWMAAAGFRIGDRVQVAVERGRLIVTTEEEC